ncbi:hypothetical protein ABT294_18890 [Nonomuraea sp. NPDC000554]|uniref:hypothetical protein n=1 Tax=Nonomuraea sp. NPDC000554 TaxID=3154259 RepID=UPI00331A424B
MITLTIVGLVSVMLTGCAADDDDVTADCVDTTTQLPDGTYEVVDDSFCEDDASYAYGDDDDGGGGNHYFYNGSRGAYHWYYGGTRHGNRVRSGTTYRPSDVNISSRNGRSIQRGGFGSHWGGGG